MEILYHWASFFDVPFFFCEKIDSLTYLLLPQANHCVCVCVCVFKQVVSRESSPSPALANYQV